MQLDESTAFFYMHLFVEFAIFCFNDEKNKEFGC